MFSQHWFDELAKTNFEKNVLPFCLQVQGPLKYLEIGCFEGNSVLYMCKDVFAQRADPSYVTVIDPFDESETHQIHLERFQSNCSAYLDQITIIKGFSNLELQKLPKEEFDLIYIDGDHTSYAALVDGILSFPLLKKGGMMVFDDYVWKGGDQDINHAHNPFTGINYFLDTFKGQYELIDKNWQVTIRKL